MGSIKEKFKSSSNRLAEERPSLSPEDSSTVEFYRIYCDLAREKKGRLITSLPYFKTRLSNISEVKAHPNWSHFQKARELCNELRVSYDEWIMAQFMMCGAWRTNKNLQANDGVPFPNMLHGDGAITRFGWFLDEILRDEGGTVDYLKEYANLKATWQGPINLATRLKNFLDKNDRITPDVLYLIVSAFPGMFEMEYLVTHPILGEMVLGDRSELKKDSEKTLNQIKEMGDSYLTELIETYNRSVEQVRDVYPNEFEELSRWL